MNFLDLCRKVARDSGTISGDRPATVSNQPGRLGKIVHFVRDAWNEIQLDRDDWQWMEQEFSFTATPNVASYGAGNTGLGDLARFIEDSVTLYDPVIGPADEGALQALNRRAFRARFQVGAQKSDRPVCVSLDGKGSLMLGPTPDKAFQVRGLYLKDPQNLIDDTDIPECPSRFHDVIAYRALMWLGEYDEDQMAVVRARRLYRNLRDDLVRSEAAPVRLGGKGMA